MIVVAVIIIVAGVALLFISQLYNRPVGLDFGPPPPRPARASAPIAMLPPPMFPKRSTMPVPSDVTEVRLPNVRLEDEVRMRLVAARKHLDQAEREFEAGKPALALEDVTLTSAALVDLHWPLMRLAGAKP